MNLTFKPLPLNLVMFASTARHFGYDTYATTIKHYERALGGNLNVFQQRFCHVKVRPTETDRLPDIIDFLLDHDIKPIVTQGEWTRGLSHGREYLKDMFKVYNTQEVHAAPFTFFTEDDEPLNVKLAAAHTYLEAAINVLNANKDILNVRFQRDGVSNQTWPVNELLHRVDTLDFQSFVARTRDLFLAAKIIQDNARAFENVQCEAAFRMASESLSASPYRFLCFNPSLASSHHIGAEAYPEIMKTAEFKDL